MKTSSSLMVLRTASPLAGSLMACVSFFEWSLNTLPGFTELVIFHDWHLKHESTCWSLLILLHDRQPSRSSFTARANGHTSYCSLSLVPLETVLLCDSHMLPSRAFPGFMLSASAEPKSSPMTSEGLAQLFPSDCSVRVELTSLSISVS